MESLEQHDGNKLNASRSIKERKKQITKSLRGSHKRMQIMLLVSSLANGLAVLAKTPTK
jgi:hypothetical protein